MEPNRVDINPGPGGVVVTINGAILPGATIVCGDSHTACHGGLGALAFGIGTSEVEHVLATQTLLLKQSKNMEVRIEGELGAGVTAKDVVLHICGVLGASGGTGYVIEYTGSAIRSLSLEGRLTVSNMAIEHGARAGLIAPLAGAPVDRPNDTRPDQPNTQPSTPPNTSPDA